MTPCIVSSMGMIAATMT